MNSCETCGWHKPYLGDTEPSCLRTEYWVSCCEASMWIPDDEKAKEKIRDQRVEEFLSDLTALSKEHHIVIGGYDSGLMLSTEDAPLSGNLCDSGEIEYKNGSYRQKPTN